MAKTKNLKVETFGKDDSYIKITDVNEREEKTVIGVVEAEKLQVEGWQLIDCHLTPEGKEYKFRKDK
jgi:hypothetical protein